jgi:hypothetical protein
MADKSNDPVAMWQNMIGEMEKGFNSFANQAMTSPEFSKVMNQVGSVGAGAQKQLGELMEKYLVHNNSGAPAGGYAAPKPPRTKRPPSTAGGDK